MLDLIRELTAADARRNDRLEEADLARKVKRLQEGRPRFCVRLVARVGDFLIALGQDMKERQATVSV